MDQAPSYKVSLSLSFCRVHAQYTDKTVISWTVDDSKFNIEGALMRCLPLPSPPGLWTLTLSLTLSNSIPFCARMLHFICVITYLMCMMSLWFIVQAVVRDMP